MPSPQTILVIEDERHLAGLLRDYLLAADFNVQVLYSGDGAQALVAEGKVDLVLLDLMLPGTSGVQICRQLREISSLPIIMTTARIEETDRLTGFEVGADDYICKPYSPREVVARVKAVLKRAATSQPIAGTEPRLLSEHCLLRVGQQDITLTAIESRLLELLMAEPGRVFSRQYISEHIYRDYRVVSERTIDSHIKKIRKKIADQGNGLELIHSVYGLGYKYDYSQHKHE